MAVACLGLKRCVGAKSCGLGKAAGKIRSKPQKVQGKRLFVSRAEQRAAYNYIVEQDKKGSFSLLPAQQSSSDKPSSAPNVAKDLTDAGKTELGGTGSGAPSGWEPEDEENARENVRQGTTVEELTSTSSKG